MPSSGRSSRCASPSAALDKSQEPAFGLSRKLLVKDGSRKNRLTVLNPCSAAETRSNSEEAQAVRKAAYMLYVPQKSWNQSVELHNCHLPTNLRFFAYKLSAHSSEQNVWNALLTCYCEIRLIFLNWMNKPVQNFWISCTANLCFRNACNNNIIIITVILLASFIILLVATKYHT